VGLLYDPVGRLYQVTQGARVTRFDTLGGRILGEMTDTGATLRRFVPGPATSPDRADAMVWALWELMLAPRAGVPRIRAP
jgi:phage terminase large subunit-like protein